MDGDDGLILEDGETYAIVFTRRLRQSIQKVWAALTLPERLADWLAAATIEPDLRIGARFSLHFVEGDYRMTGEIVELRPPRLIAWTWPDPRAPEDAPVSVVRFELEPDGDGCRLTLTNTHVIRADLASVGAGWHTHLEGLGGAVDGIRTDWSAGHERVHATRYRGAVEMLP